MDQDKSTAQQECYEFLDLSDVDDRERNQLTTTLYASAHLNSSNNKSKSSSSSSCHSSSGRNRRGVAPPPFPTSPRTPSACSNSSSSGYNSKASQRRGGEGGLLLPASVLTPSSRAQSSSEGLDTDTSNSQNSSFSNLNANHVLTSPATAGNWHHEQPYGPQGAVIGQVGTTAGGGSGAPPLVRSLVPRILPPLAAAAAALPIYAIVKPTLVPVCMPTAAATIPGAAVNGASFETKSSVVSETETEDTSSTVTTTSDIGVGEKEYFQQHHHHQIQQQHQQLQHPYQSNSKGHQMKQHQEMSQQHQSHGHHGHYQGHQQPQQQPQQQHQNQHHHPQQQQPPIHAQPTYIGPGGAAAAGGGAPLYQMLPHSLSSNVYVSNMTANVNVQGFVPPQQYMASSPQTTFISNDMQTHQTSASPGIGHEMQQQQSQQLMGGGHPAMRGNNRRNRGGRGSNNNSHRREFNTRQQGMHHQQQQQQQQHQPQQSNAQPQQQPPEMINQIIDPQQAMTAPGYFPGYYVYPNYYANHMGHHPGSAQHATGHPIYVQAAPTMQMYNPHLAYGHPQGMFVYSPVMSPEYTIIGDKGDESGNYDEMVQPGTVPAPHLWPQHAAAQNAGSQIEFSDPNNQIPIIQNTEQITIEGDQQVMGPVEVPSQHVLNPNVANFMTIEQQLEQQQQQQQQVEVVSDLEYQPFEVPPQEYINPQQQQIYNVENNINGGVNNTSVSDVNNSNSVVGDYQIQQSQVPLTTTTTPTMMIPPNQEILMQNPKVPVVTTIIERNNSSSGSSVLNNSNSVNNINSAAVAEMIIQQPQNQQPMTDNVDLIMANETANNNTNVINSNVIQNVPNAVYTVNSEHSNNGGVMMSNGTAKVVMAGEEQANQQLANLTQEKLAIFNETTLMTNQENVIVAWNDNNNNSLLVGPSKKTPEQPQISPRSPIERKNEPSKSPIPTSNIVSNGSVVVQSTATTAQTSTTADHNNKKTESKNSVNTHPELDNQPTTLPVAKTGGVSQVVPKRMEAVAPERSNPPPSGPPSWSALFKSNTESAGHLSDHQSTTMPNSLGGTKKPVAKVSPFEPTQTHPVSMNPGTMSYSAASSLGLPPQTTNSTAVISNQVAKPTSDNRSMKLGEYLTKYQLDNSSISLNPRGLTNRSNYCYINAIIQALVACPPFYHMMKSIPMEALDYKEKSTTPIIDALVELVSEFSPLSQGARLNKREKGPKGKEEIELLCAPPFEPTVIHKILNSRRSDSFKIEGRQEDAEEFLGYLLNGLNDEMLELMKMIEKPPLQNGGDAAANGETQEDEGDDWQVICGNRNKGTVTRTTDFGRTPISDVFGGRVRSRVQREGDHSTDVIQPFFTLQLDIEKAASVKEALEILVVKDQLEGITCSKTNQEVAAWQQVTLEKLPVVLILHLKWFHYNVDGCTKILKTVDFPIELKIDTKILSSKKYQSKQKQYKLFAVVYHDGKEASKGHYITDVFNVGYSSWIRYDDNTVKPVKEHQVLHPKAPRVPYLLYYRRSDTISQTQQGGGAPSSSATGATNSGNGR